MYVAKPKTVLERGAGIIGAGVCWGGKKYTDGERRECGDDDDNNIIEVHTRTKEQPTTATTTTHTQTHAAEETKPVWLSAT